MAHLAEVNAMLIRMRGLTDRNSAEMARAVTAARQGSQAAIDEAMRLKQEGGGLIAAVERVRQVYWDIFGQRQTRIGRSIFLTVASPPS